MFVDPPASYLVEVKWIVWSNHEPLVFEMPTAAWKPTWKPGSMRKAGRDAAERR